MKIKHAKAMISKAVGTAGENALKYRIAIPNQWIAALNISKEHPEVELVLDGDKIILQKASISEGILSKMLAFFARVLCS